MVRKPMPPDHHQRHDDARAALEVSEAHQGVGEGGEAGIAEGADRLEDGVPGGRRRAEAGQPESHSRRAPQRLEQEGEEDTICGQVPEVDVRGDLGAAAVSAS